VQFNFLCRAVEISQKVSTNGVSSYPIQAVDHCQRYLLQEPSVLKPNLPIVSVSALGTTGSQISQAQRAIHLNPIDNKVRTIDWYDARELGIQ
jgi:hypothetical protein